MASAGRENRLAREKSPYLLQHKANPVDWYPWGPEAFDKARKEKKLIFLSVGYSTCHWCHVMERESFECEETGALLNRHFVAVKVDREERPDVDKLYMTFIQAISGSGGWPMSVFLTPSLKPITGGTYFPPEDRYGRPGFKTILKYIAAQAEEVESQGKMFQDAIAEMEAKNKGAADELPSLEALDKCYAMMKSDFDPRLGGIGKAPKFPQPSNYEFLLRYAHHRRDTEEGAVALVMVEKTLEYMEKGGIHDWVNRGYHRYSTDQRWHVPHFEKMLYDNAQLTALAAEAYQMTGKSYYADMVRDIVTYVNRDLSHPAGGFYSAEDADSLATPADVEKKEGAFCVWTHKELTELLSDPVKPGSDHPLSSLVIAHFGCKERGNVDPSGDPHGELANQNVLIAEKTPGESGQTLGLDAQEAVEALERARLILFEARKKRPKPHLDDKIITAWNGAKGDIEQRGQPTDAFLDDYAFLIQGLLDLFTATQESEWLAWALELQERMDAEFWDGEGSYFLSSKDGDPNLSIRMRDDQDGAEPSSNSVGAINAVRLAALLDKKELRTRAEAVLKGWAGRISKIPIVLPKMLAAIKPVLSPAKQIVVVGEKGSADTDALVDALRTKFLPEATIIVLEDGGSEWLRTRVSHLKSLQKVDGKATAYVCHNFVCSLPVSEPGELLAKL